MYVYVRDDVRESTGGVCHGTHWSEDNFQDSALAFPFIEAGALAVSAVGHT